MTSSLFNSKTKCQKILVIQFKYLGDAVFITPAIQAIKLKHPEAEIHLLVAEEVAPIFANIDFIKRVWALPRTRGKAKILQSLPFIRQLRKECFDTSIDFVGNDRGGILSLLIAAKSRLAAIEGKPSLLQKLAYTKTVETSLLPASWVKRHLSMLVHLFGTSESSIPDMKIFADTSLALNAKEALDGHEIICHLGTSQPKKEWPIHRWIEFYNLATQAGYKLAFTSGTNSREQDLMIELRKYLPSAFALAPSNNLGIYLAILAQAKLVISGDTGPLHFAAGLGVKVIGLFGTADSVRHAAPIYKTHELVMSRPCTCIGELAEYASCQSTSSCMDSISAEQVFESLQDRYPLNET